MGTSGRCLPVLGEKTRGVQRSPEGGVGLGGLVPAARRLWDLTFFFILCLGYDFKLHIPVGKCPSLTLCSGVGLLNISPAILWPGGQVSLRRRHTGRMEPGLLTASLATLTLTSLLASIWHGRCLHWLSPLLELAE